MENNKKQFVRLPTQESHEISELTPAEQLVYLGVRSFMNGQTKQCNPSYNSILQRVGLNSVNTLKKYLQSLQQKSYICIESGDRGKSNNYIFLNKPELSHWEDFMMQFVESEDYPFKEKAFLVGVQRFLYDKQTGKGNTSFDPFELGKRMQLTPSTVMRLLKTFERKGIVTIRKANIIRNQDGTMKNPLQNEFIYEFNLTKYNPLYYIVQEHEEKISDIQIALDIIMTPEQKKEFLKRKQQEVKEPDYIII